MKRILVSHMPPPGETVEASSEESHHLRKVRRTQTGETIEVLDGKGGLALGEIEPGNDRYVRVKIVARVEANRESPLQLELAVGYPQQHAVFDHSLPALVQLGVNRVTLVHTTHGGTLKKGWEPYRQRLEAICLQALKQCGRLVVPVLDYVPDWSALCRSMVKRNEHNVVFHPVPSTYAVSEGRAYRSLGLLIGPEGGFTEEEVVEAKRCGMEIRGMGPRILKMETAMIGACYHAQHAFGDLAG